MGLGFRWKGDLQLLEKYTALVAAIAAMGCISAISAELDKQTPLIDAITSGSLVATLYAMSGRRLLFRVGIALYVPMLLAGLARIWIAAPWLAPLHFSLSAVFAFLAAGALLRMVLEEREVSGDTIIGGVGTYLLLAVAFAFTHALVSTLLPGSYGSAHGALARSSMLVHELLYFSFTTITTLGYGDIHPTRPIAEMVATTEAMLGQFYVAIFVARLVGLHVSKGRSSG